MVGREKVYTSLEHVAITLQPDDLKRLDAIPGNSRNERIVHLLAVYDAANLVCAADETENLEAILDFVTALHTIMERSA